VLIIPSDHHCLLCKAAKLWGKRCVQLQHGKKHDVAPNSDITEFRSSRGSAVGPLLAMTLALSLEHAPSVPQGVGSDKLIKDVRTIMYLVCLVVLVSKE
jgi:hypothetical protein